MSKVHEEAAEEPYKASSQLPDNSTANEFFAKLVHNDYDKHVNGL
jgi:hypothetical protein